MEGKEIFRTSKKTVRSPDIEKERVQTGGMAIGWQELKGMLRELKIGNKRGW